MDCCCQFICDTPPNLEHSLQFVIYYSQTKEVTAVNESSVSVPAKAIDSGSMYQQLSLLQD